MIDPFSISVLALFYGVVVLFVVYVLHPLKGCVIQYNIIKPSTLKNWFKQRQKPPAHRLRAGLDYTALNRCADLLELAGQGLKRVASSAGGEWAGPCPLCGGKDRFHVQPHHQPAPRWLCRRCTDGRWRSALDFVMLRDGVGVRRAGEVLQQSAVSSQLSAGGGLGYGQQEAELTPDEMVLRVKEAGDDTWGTSGLLLLERSIRELWHSTAGEHALDWLVARGLQESTLRAFLVGWSPGMRQGGLYAPMGVTLPCLEGERLWSIKIALLPDQVGACQGCRGRMRARQPCPACGAVNKYRAVRGGRAALFNAGDLLPGRPALFVEGEFDCMVAWQVLRDEMGVVTLGSATASFELRRWGPRLLAASAVYTLLDNDPAGEKGRQAIRQVTGGASIDLRLPAGVKDVNDFVLAGGDLRAVVLET